MDNLLAFKVARESMPKGPGDLSINPNNIPQYDPCEQRIIYPEGIKMNEYGTCSKALLIGVGCCSCSL